MGSYDLEGIVTLVLLIFSVLNPKEHISHRYILSSHTVSFARDPRPSLLKPDWARRIPLLFYLFFVFKLDFEWKTCIIFSCEWTENRIKLFFRPFNSPTLICICLIGDAKSNLYRNFTLIPASKVSKGIC